MASGLHAFTVQEAQNAKLGQGGYMYLDQTGGSGGGSGTDNTGTAANGVEYVAVQVLEAATVSTVSNDTTTYPNLATITVPAGTTIYGRWNKVTIATSNATALCYRG
tara:strand:+ start:17560 stop:17880 length:321 start_codon:yes stop_codon:yes gene_type:complete